MDRDSRRDGNRDRDGNSDRGTHGASRRGLLLAGGGALAGLALAGVSEGASPGASTGASPGTEAAAHLAPRGRARALPPSKRFDLKDPADPLFTHRKAWCPTVMQSFGFDHINGHVYVIQTMYNPGDGVPHRTRLREGDLAVTQLSMDGSRRLARMYLRNFGHGAQIGVQPTKKGSAPYIWVEYASKPVGDPQDPDNPDKQTGFGTKVCRLRFVGPPAGRPPRSFHWNNAADRRAMGFQDKMPDVAALPGPGDSISSPRPVIDPVHGRLLLRFGRAGATQCAVYDLAAASAGRPTTVLAHRPDLPRLSWPQGFCLYGSSVYLYEGKPYQNGGPGNPDDKGTTHITRVDLNSGVRTRELTRALKSLTWREPEGMAILPGPAPRLCFGFASGKAGDRRVNIAYKDRLV